MAWSRLRDRVVSHPPGGLVGVGETAQPPVSTGHHILSCGSWLFACLLLFCFLFVFVFW